MKLNGLEKYFKTMNGEIVDFTQIDEYGETPLMYSFLNNKSKNLNLNKKQFDFLIKNSNLKQNNHRKWNTLMVAICLKKSEKLNLSAEQWDYLIKNNDLKLKNNVNWTSLIYILKNYKINKINFKNESWDYLLRNSDLKHIDDINNSPIIFALNQAEKLNLSVEQWKFFIENSDLSLITNQEQLLELKKIQSNLLNEEILNKIDNIKNINKKVKI